MIGDRIRFEGVVVGFESPEGIDEPTLYIQGSIDGEDRAFYLIVPRDMYEEYRVSGVGKMLSGVGVIVKEEPLIIKYLSEEG